MGLAQWLSGLRLWASNVWDPGLTHGQVSKIKPVNPKGNQPWMFIGRTDATAEAPIPCHLMWRADSLEKTLMLGKIEGKRRRGWQRMRWVNTITDSMDMNLSKLWEMAKDWGTWCAVVHGVPKSQTQHNDWTTTINNTATLFEQIKSDHFQEQSDLKILSCFKATQTTKSKFKVRGPPAQWSSPGLSTKI